MKSLDIVRWVGIAPVAVVAWHAALISGMAIHGLVNDICPYGTVVSGLCTGPWFRTASEIIMNFFVTLSAVLVVFSAAWVAPNHKGLVAFASYVTGAAFAVAMAVDLEEWDKLASALIAGLAAAIVVHRKHRHADNPA